MSFIYVYMIVMMFIFTSILASVIKLRKIMMENTEFSIKIQQISAPPNAIAIVCIALPVVHILPLILYVYIALAPDQQIVDLFCTIMEARNEMEFKASIDQEIQDVCEILDKCNKNDLDFLSYKYQIIDILYQKGYDTKTLENIDDNKEFLNQLRNVLNLD